MLAMVVNDDAGSLTPSGVFDHREHARSYRGKKPENKKGRCKRSGQRRRWIQELQINVDVHGVMTRYVQII